MKILRIKVDGLPLYKEPFDISFLAVQRVENSHLDSLSNLFGNIYVNTVEAFIGINASGKTTALKVISFANMLLRAVPLNSYFAPQILGNDIPTVFDIDFYYNNKIYHLSTEVIKQTKDDGSRIVKILSEKLWEKIANTKVNKTNIFSFDGIEPIRVRDFSDEYLSDDVSIMIALNKQFEDMSLYVNLEFFTDNNIYIPDGGNVPAEVIALLDPTIEYIIVENKDKKFITRLKFYNQDELVIYNPNDINIYLSSGTIKGVRIFKDAIQVLNKGGYLVIDEIENHFNRELVASLIRLFMNRRTNPNGAAIIFSTHYPELLDELERNDSVFITKSNQGLEIKSLNTLLTRNDMKKSEVYQSNYLGGTAPKYNAWMALQKSIIKNLEV